MRTVHFHKNWVEIHTGTQVRTYPNVTISSFMRLWKLYFVAQATSHAYPTDDYYGPSVIMWDHHLQAAK